MIHKRLLPAVLLVLLFAAVLLLGRWAVVATAFGLFLALNWEDYFTAIGPRRVVGAVAVNTLLPVFYLLGGISGWAAAVMVCAIVIPIAQLVLIERGSDEAPNLIELRLCGLAYPGVLGSLLVVVAHIAPLREVALLVAVVSVSDTAAYLGGRWWGGPKLAPLVSPSKTTSGAVIAVVCSAAAAPLVAWLLKLPGSIFCDVFFGLALSVFAQFGDLSESLLKRRLVVKNMATLFGGQGSVFYLLDGYLFAAPLFLLGRGWLWP